jgi:hypothetical protein
VVATPSAVNETSILAGPAVAAVGAAKAAPGVTAEVNADTIWVSPLPLGVMVNSYDVELVRPVTVQLVAVAAIAVVLVSVQVGPATSKFVPL